MIRGDRTTFGPSAWLQQHWDARAATNFVVGGAGGGMLAAAGAAVAMQAAPAGLIVPALVLMAIGLTAVWFEIGRKLRALHVYFNPFTSWMTREAFVAAAAFALGFAALVVPAPAWTRVLALVAALAGVAFAYCQARMLHASRGIPAWREPAIVPFVVATDLAEGVALAAMALGDGARARYALPLLVALLAVRLATWLRYRGRLAGRLTRQAEAALARAHGALVWAGTVAALALAGIALLSPTGLAMAATAAAALATIAGGWIAKFLIVTRASYNQGFALPKLPVRGGR
jgi:phenylacetyl-CoA:acceptor oxidoreductase subunit 2